MKPHLLFVLPVLLLAAACGTRETAPSEPDPTEAHTTPPPPPAAKPVEIVGAITSRTSQAIASDFDAKVVHLLVHNGQPVRKGDLVAELDTTQLENKLREAKGQLQRAKGAAARAGAGYGNARRQAQLQRRMVNLGAAAPEALRVAETERSQFGADGAAAAGDVETAKASIADLEGQLAKAKVTAPFDGIISAVKYREGELASKASPIARVFDPNQMIVKFAVPRKLVAQYKLGLAIELVTDQGHVAVPASIKTPYDQADPAVDYVVFEALIDPTFRTDGIRVGDIGRVRIAGAQR